MRNELIVIFKGSFEVRVNLQERILNKLFFIILFIATIYPIDFVIGQDQEIRFRNYSVGQGLSQSTVISICQDKNGFLWFGTRTGGLNKFDGNTFIQYSRDRGDSTSISGNEILSLFEDSEGYIWVGTRNEGLNKFDVTTGIFEKFFTSDDDLNTIPHNTINDIGEDNNGKIWIATNSGLCYYDKSTSVPNRLNSWTGFVA